jgi:hypothetical protein
VDESHGGPEVGDDRGRADVLLDGGQLEQQRPSILVGERLLEGPRQVARRALETGLDGGARRRLAQQLDRARNALGGCEQELRRDLLRHGAQLGSSPAACACSASRSCAGTFS